MSRDEQRLISELKQWVRRGDNSPAKMAYLLGYTSSNTVYSWIRGNVPIPGYQTAKIKEILHGKDDYKSTNCREETG